MDQDASERLSGEKWAYGLTCGFLLVMFIVALTVWIDNQNRTNIEQISEPTAVADPVTLRFDPRENPGREVLQRNGQPYFLQTNEPVKLPDFDALKVGKDDMGKVELYQVKKQNDLRVVLVKIAANEFLRLTPR
jgi:hypothetical protein